MGKFRFGCICDCGGFGIGPAARVEDVGFTNVVVTPMRSDRVFLYCNEGRIFGKFTMMQLTFS